MTDLPDPLAGLDDDEAARPAGDFFDQFPWESLALDPETTPAEEFLRAL